MRKAMLFICLMTAIAASAQNVEEEWIPDSIATDITTDSTAIDTQESQPDIEEVEWDDRYTVAEKDGKYGLYDVNGDSLLTDLIYDEAGPAFRKRVFDEYITYYYIRQGEQSGVVGVFESTGGITTILASRVISQSADENWEDSVRVYRSLVRDGDTEANWKLAVCYLEGKGVKKNFMQAIWMMILAADDNSERAEGLFLSLPEDDENRIKFEATKAFINGELQQLKGVNERLAPVDSASHELVSGLIAMVEKRKEDALAHFNMASEMGCTFAELFKGAVSDGYSDEQHILAMERIAEESPFVYSVLGDMMLDSSKWGKKREDKAHEYYMKADEHACLSKKGKAFLESKREKNE